VPGVWLDSETDRTLERLARSRSVSKSEVVRQAIELLASHERQALFDQIADLIGCAQGGPPDLAEGTGTRFRQLLTEPKEDPRPEGSGGTVLDL
jgi:hypothetical protein